MRLLDDYARVSRALRCPICGKPDWCLVSRINPDDPDTVICARVESAVRFGRAGWLHVLRPDAGRRRGPWRRVCTVGSPEPSRDDLPELLAELRENIDLERLGQLAADLGVSADSLQALGIGLATGELVRRVNVIGASFAWAFPMHSARGALTGIRLRLPSGKKLSVRGGREGLFVAASPISDAAPLYVVEGPTDAAALLDLGLHVIGRPSAQGGARHVRDYVLRQGAGTVIVFGDRDEAGRSGALQLARLLRSYVSDVRIAAVPEGYKDPREWIRAGSCREDVDLLIDEAPRLEAPIAVAGEEVAS